jgi:hypothetical protein
MRPAKPRWTIARAKIKRAMACAGAWRELDAKELEAYVRRSRAESPKSPLVRV